MPHPDILKLKIKPFDCIHLKLQDTRTKKQTITKIKRNGIYIAVTSLHGNNSKLNHNYPIWVG